MKPATHDIIEFLPVVNGPWTCDECLDISLGQILIATFCYPCLYGAVLQRVCRTPQEQRALCAVDDWVWWGGCCCPVCAGIVARKRFSDRPRPGWCRAACYETVCCVCIGAPCAMDDFRLYNCEIGTLLTDPDIELYDDKSPYAIGQLGGDQV